MWWKKRGFLEFFIFFWIGLSEGEGCIAKDQRLEPVVVLGEWPGTHTKLTFDYGGEGRENPFTPYFLQKGGERERMEHEVVSSFL